MRSISEVRRGKPPEMQSSMQRILHLEYVMYASYSGTRLSSVQS